MSYPGNASLAQDIQDRVLDTFQQTLDLVESESLQEAKLGCDFILRLDPMFEPARWLQDRLAAADGAVVLDDLKEALADARASAANGDGGEADAAAGEADPAGAPEDGPEEADAAAAPPESEATATGDETPDVGSTESEAETLVADDVADAEPDAPEVVEDAGETDAEVEPDAPEATETASEDASEDADETIAADADTEVEPEAAEAIEAASEDAEIEPDAAEALDAAGADDKETPVADDEPSDDAGEEAAATTQATAFGDEERSPEPATAEEVMAAPVAALDTESEQRIQDLLAEGQSAFDSGEYQTAIDAWSRIFLIDIDHPEASERIEAARKLKAEAERTVEEAFHEALDQIDSGALDEGRAGLEKVLEMQPDHLAAREQLERLEGGATPETAAPPTPTPAEDEAPAAEAAEADGALSDIDDSLDLDEPAPAAAGAGDGQASPIPVPKQRKQPKKKADFGDKRKVLIYVGAGLLALVLVGGWLVVSNWSKFFPNTAETVETAGERPDPIERAEELHAAGKTSTAIAQLKRLPPQHELYSEAQALVAQWEAAAVTEADEEEPTDTALAEFEALVERARSAQARGEYLEVDELLSRAAAIRPLDAEAAELKALAAEQLEPLETQVAIFRQGEWELVLRDLWRMREDLPDSPDINRLMVDSYYNLGVRALQRGDTNSAADHFGEALQLTADDSELVRANRFAQTYRDRPEDLLYRIYVKYLPFR